MFYLHLSFQLHQFAPVRAHPQHSICTVRWRVHHQPRTNGSDRPRATKLFCRHGAGEFLVLHSVLPLRNSVEVGGREGECCDGVGGNGTDWRHVLLAEARRRHAGTPPPPPLSPLTDVCRTVEYSYRFRHFPNRTAFIYKANFCNETQSPSKSPYLITTSYNPAPNLKMAFPKRRDIIPLNGGTTHPDS